MKIWEIDLDRSYKFRLSYVKENDSEIALRVVGESLVSGWNPIPVEMIRTNGKVVEGDPSKLGDFPYIGMLPVCSEHARKILEPLVADDVEFLPLKWDAGQFYLFNITNMVPCLDHQHSEFRLWSTGNIRSITKYAFDAACVEGQHIFKIPELPRGSEFVSDTFKALVEDHKLKGLLFEQVWEHPVSDDRKSDQKL